MPSALTETQQLNNNGEGFFLFSVTKSRTKGIDELLIRFSCRAARKCFLSVGKKCNNGSSRTMQRYWRRFFSLGGRLRLPANRLGFWVFFYDDSDLTPTSAAGCNCRIPTWRHEAAFKGHPSIEQMHFASNAACTLGRIAPPNRFSVDHFAQITNQMDT